MAITALDAAIPEIWSGLVNEAFAYKSVMTNLVTFKWSSPITAKLGDTVRLFTFPEPTYGAYTKGTDVTPQALDPVETVLKITDDDALEIEYDNYEEAMSVFTSLNPIAVNKIANAAIKKFDDDIMAEYANFTTALDAGDFGGVAGAAVTIDVDNVLVCIEKMRETLSGYEVGRSDTFVVVPPKVTTLIARALYGKAANPPTFASEALRELWVQRHAGFDIYESTRLPVSGTYILAFHRECVGFSGAIKYLKLKEPAFRDSGLIFSRILYGAKTINPNYGVSLLIA